MSDTDPDDPFEAVRRHVAAPRPSVDDFASLTNPALVLYFIELEAAVARLDRIVQAATGRVLVTSQTLQEMAEEPKT